MDKIHTWIKINTLESKKNNEKTLLVQGHRNLLILPSEVDIFLAGCAHLCRITWPKR